MAGAHSAATPQHHSADLYVDCLAAVPDAGWDLGRSRRVRRALYPARASTAPANPPESLLSAIYREDSEDGLRIITPH